MPNRTLDYDDVLAPAEEAGVPMDQLAIAAAIAAAESGLNPQGLSKVSVLCVACGAKHRKPRTTH